MSDYLLKECRKDKWRYMLKPIDTITGTAYISRTRCRRLWESRRPGCGVEDQFQLVKDTSEPAVNENVVEALASGHQSTSSTDGQHVIRKLLDSSCIETILLSRIASGEISEGARRTSGLRPRHNTAGLLLLDRLVESVNRYFEEQSFKSVVLLGTTTALDALGRVHTKQAKQKQNRNSAVCDKSAKFMKHFYNFTVFSATLPSLVAGPVLFCCKLHFRQTILSAVWNLHSVLRSWI